MKKHSFFSDKLDVWPAFTDFIISVLLVIILFMLGIFFINIARELLAVGNEFNTLKNKQLLVRQKLNSIQGIKVQESGNLQRIVLQVDKEGKGGVLFDSGQASLKEEGKELLKKIANVLKDTATHYKTVQVEGHTDDKPINSIQYRSNWELSAARAGAVVNYLLEQQSLDPWRFSASGRGEYKPYNVPETEMNETSQFSNNSNNRLPDYVIKHNIDSNAALNRRIEIILIY